MYYLRLLYWTYHARHNMHIPLAKHSVKAYYIQSAEIDKIISNAELEAGMHGNHFSYYKPIRSYL
jgi:hypothetical protein